MHPTAAQTTAHIRALLAERGIPQSALADYLGMKQQGVSRRLTGAVPFDVDELARVAQFLGLHVSELVGPWVTEEAS
jgi:transcriptional regulator with XRE-family HTH domain